MSRLREWLGVHCVQALTEGKTLEGWWFNRAQEYLARRRGKDFGPFQYATRETLELDLRDSGGISSRQVLCIALVSAV